MLLNLASRKRGSLADFISRPLSREDLFAVLCALACMNGLVGHAARQIARAGWLSSIFDTFGISILVLVGCYFGVTFLLREQRSEIQSRDLPVVAGTSALILVPIVAASWLALACLALYVLVTAYGRRWLTRGSIILLATTLPTLWVPLLFHLFSGVILQVDATIVAQILQTQRVGNMVRFFDDSGYLVIFPACSSLSGVSMALLCWVVTSEAAGHRWAASDLIWCLAACLSAIAVNVGRMSLMALSDWHFQVFHSSLGATSANVLALALAFGFCVLGTRRDLFART